MCEKSSAEARRSCDPPARDLRDAFRKAGSARAKARLLNRRRPSAESAADRILESCREGDLMKDPDLKLLAAWLNHVRGRSAERDYYLYAMESAEDRACVRRELGIRRPPRPERLAVLITVDCLRGDRLSANGYGRPTTPAIDRLAASGLNFPRAYSTAGQTAQSFPGILMSNFFQNFGRSRAVPDHLATLPEVLREHGFHTLALNAANPHVSHFYGYQRGFDDYQDFLDRNTLPDGYSFCDDSPGRREGAGDEELERVLEDLTRRPQVHAVLRDLTGLGGVSLARCIVQRHKFYPYSSGDVLRDVLRRLHGLRGGSRAFCWLHLMDLHENISVPFSRLDSFSTVQQYFLDRCNCLAQQGHPLRGQHEKYSRLYDAAASYVDWNLEILLNFLSDNDILQRSLICVTADHGQQLLENGIFGHGFDRLDEPLVHVPLVLGGALAEGLEGADTPDRPVSTLDLAPTILEACGIEEAPGTFLGTPLTDTRPRPVYSQSFYEGADNRSPDPATREFLLNPFPVPVRECCREIRCCIEGPFQVIQDLGRGTTQVERLRSAGPSDPDRQPPRPAAVERQMAQYFDGIYRVPDRQAAREPAGGEKELVAGHLRALGYM